MVPRLFIINGPPGAGKSSLARRLAPDLNLPLFTKDDIKERLFDRLGWSDRAWSRTLGGASFDILFYVIEAEVSADRSLMVETYFHQGIDDARFHDIHSRHAFEPVEVYCTALGETLWERVSERARSGDRHPGHVETQGYDELAPVLLHGKHGPLKLGGPVITIDTTDIAGIDYHALLATLRDLVPGHQ